MKNLLVFILPLAALLASCVNNNAETSYWEVDDSWYTNCAVADTGFVDVFYIASTDVISSVAPDGSESFRAMLTPEEKENIKAELDYVSHKFYPDSVNMFAPYYHQYTMNSIALPKEQFDSLATYVVAEVCEAFDYYMEHYNGGRKFVIAGFSQGGQMTIELLKHLTNEQYSQMVAAYAIGFGVNSDDLMCKHVVPAKGADDNGVVISFNSVADTSTIWDFVHNNAKVCINPVNWSTTDAEASFSFQGQNLTAKQDTVNHVVIVNGFEERQPLGFDAPWPKGNLHHYDLLFYAPMIKHNTLFRFSQTPG